MNDKRDEKIGKAVFGVTYLLYAFFRVVLYSLIALLLLYLFQKPLWLSPVIGIGAFLILRFFRRLVFGLLIRFGRWANKD